MAVQTWFEYMQSLSPSKLAIFLRKKLAHNQGCPPASLMWIFTACGKHGSCDECWWAWLDSERDEKKEDATMNVEVYKCWECRWGARCTQGGHPVVACMHKDMYGVIMQPDAFCSNNEERYWEGKQNALAKLATNVAFQSELITEENADQIGKELQRRYELKQLKREIERRKQEEKNNETACKCEEDKSPAPDRGGA